MCPVFTAVCVCVLVCVHVHTMYIFSCDDEAQCIWYPQLQGGQGKHTYTHCLTLFLSLLVSHCHLSQTHTCIHRPMCSLYIKHTQMDVITQRTQRHEHMQQYSQNAHTLHSGFTETKLSKGGEASLSLFNLFIYCCPFYPFFYLSSIVALSFFPDVKDLKEYTKTQSQLHCSMHHAVILNCLENFPHLMQHKYTKKQLVSKIYLIWFKYPSIHYLDYFSAVTG